MSFFPLFLLVLRILCVVCLFFSTCFVCIMSFLQSFVCAHLSSPSSPTHPLTYHPQLYFPPGISASDILPRLAQRGVVVAGGLHAEIRDKYFRIG